MKKLFNLMLLCSAVIFSFSSCSDDDDDPTVPTPESKGKKLVEVKVTEKGPTGSIEYNETISFIYNTDNKVNKIIVQDEDSNSSEIYEYIWSENKIVCQNDDLKREYTLNNDLISSVRNIKFNTDDINISSSFEYNSKCLNKITTIDIYQNGDTRTNIDSPKWKNNRLVSSHYSWDEGDYGSGEEDINIKYDEKTCKGYFPIEAITYIFDIASEDDLLLYAHPELIALKTNSLPKNIKREENDYTYKYSLDKDGYVKECDVINIEGDYIYNEKYSLTWE